MPFDDLNPMSAIAEGAAIADAILGGKLPGRDFHVVLEHALGVKAFDRTSDAWVFAPIIARNTPLPVEGSEYFTIRKDVAEGTKASISVEIWEGDPSRDFADPDNARLDTILLEVVGPKSQAQAGMDIRFRYDASGLISVKGIERASGQTILERSVELGHVRSDDARLEDLFEIDEHFEEGAALMFDLVADIRGLAVDGSSLAVREGVFQPSFRYLESALLRLAEKFPDVPSRVFVDSDFLQRLPETERRLAGARVDAGSLIMSRRGEDEACLPTVVAFAEGSEWTVVTNADLAELTEDHAWLDEGRVLRASCDGGSWQFYPQ